MTKIEWTDETWNPVTGCTRISPGCLHCYIERQTPMRVQRKRFDGDQIGAVLPVQLHPERLGKPLTWRKPLRIFVCSMADLFHDDVPDEFIARVWATMALAPRHTFQVLTKRAGRMRSLLSDPWWSETLLPEIVHQLADGRGYEMRYPLPNVWVGVSTETQKWADIRIPQLLDTPAAVRWISAEPLLGPVDLANWIPGRCACQPLGPGGLLPPIEGVHWHGCPALRYRGLDWVVVGGETGPGSRPMHPQWARTIRDQCAAAGVPYFFKQWGDLAPADVDRYSELLMFSGRDQGCVVELDGRVSVAWSMSGADLRDDGPSPTGAIMRRVGKKRAGRELDGRTWDEFPGVMPS